ncbi:unnamed protein product [Leuciscus chuanchicus]
MKIEETFSVKQEDTEEQINMMIIKEENEDMKTEEIFRVKQEETEEQRDLMALKVESQELNEMEEKDQKMDAGTFYGRKELSVRIIPNNGFISEDSELEESDSDEEWTPERGDEVNNERSEEENESENDDGEDVPQQPKWKTSHGSSFPSYPEWQGSLPNADDILSPYQYFKTFYTDDILCVIVEQSNLYAVQVNPNKPLNLTTSELEQFFGTVLYMSLFGLPATRMFWRPASRVSQVADTMTLNRWEDIKRFLHFNNNADQPACFDDNFDKLFKIQPLITHLVSKIKAIPMSEKLSVDEQMVPFKGRSRLKQYLPKKPKKWGYKLMVLAGSDGIPHNFEVYTGKVVRPPQLVDIGSSGNVVLRLAQPVPQHKNYKLYFDNWFTSVPLQLELARQGVHCLGTVRSNRLPGSNMISDAELKRSGRGSFEEKTALVSNTTLHAVKWYDNRSVTLLSDYVGAHPVTHVQRWDRSSKAVIDVPCPAVVRDYNQHMGRDMIVVTCWLLYKRDCKCNDLTNAEVMPLYAFKSYIAQGLCKSGKSLEKKRGRPSGGISNEYEAKKMRPGFTAPIPVPDVRMDATGHWIIMDEKKGRCRVPGCKGTPKAKCRKCNTHLCFTSTSNCFLKFHTE